MSSPASRAPSPVRAASSPRLGGAGNTATGAARALRQVLPRVGADPARFIPWTVPTPAEFATLLERHGFRVRFLAHFDRPSRMEGEQGLRTWLALFNEPLLRALGERRDAFFGEMEAACRAALRHEEGGQPRWDIDYVRLRFVASLIG